MLISTKRQKRGLAINESKTKVLQQKRRPARHDRQQEKVTIREYNLEVVNNFTYIGANIRNTLEEEVEIKGRILLANRIYYRCCLQ